MCKLTDYSLIFKTNKWVKGKVLWVVEEVCWGGMRGVALMNWCLNVLESEFLVLTSVSKLL